MTICAFCGKEADIEGTAMTDNYCIDCLRLTRSECLKAIHRLQARQPKGTRTPPTRKVTESELTHALDRLMNQ